MKATVKVVKYFGYDMGANIFALYIRTDETRGIVEKLAGKPVNIGVEEIMGRASQEQIAAAKELLKQGKTPEEVITETGCGKSTIYKIQQNINQKEKAKEILEEGKSPTAVVAATGISMGAAKRMAREIKKEITPAIKAVVDPNSTPANSVASSGLMNEKDLQQYGMPTNLQFAKVPKDLQIVIGPVGVSLAPEVLKSAIEPLKALGVENIHLTIDALKEMN